MQLSSAPGYAGDDSWVRLVDDPPDRRWRLAGNAHTHRGHLHVETFDGGASTTVNLSDIVEASPLARAWLSGFLQGQEADPHEFLGHDDDLLEGADERDDVRWETWNAWFRSRGWAPRLTRLPPAGAVPDRTDPPVPWVLVGGLFRVIRDGRWIVADPQPVEARPDTWAWPGSVCEGRGHHSLVHVTDDVTLCEDCHVVGS